jgi:hypothetical protein
MKKIFCIRLLLLFGGIFFAQNFYDSEFYFDDSADFFDAPDEIDSAEFSAEDDFYAETMADLDFADFFAGSFDEISSSAEIQNSDPGDFYSAAKIFVYDYICSGEKSPVEKSENESYETVLELDNLRILMSRAESDFKSAETVDLIFGIEGTKNGNSIKDFGEMELTADGGIWRVTEFNCFMLSDVLSLLGSMEE